MFLKECSAISLVKGTDKYSCQTDRQELKILSDSTVWTLKILPLFGYCRNSCSTRGRSFRNDTALRIQCSKLYPRTITVLCKETGITSYTCYVLPKILSVNKDKLSKALLTRAVISPCSPPVHLPSRERLFSAVWISRWSFWCYFPQISALHLCAYRGGVFASSWKMMFESSWQLSTASLHLELFQSGLNCFTRVEKYLIKWVLTKDI